MTTTAIALPTLDIAITKMTAYFEQAYRKDPTLKAVPSLLVAYGLDGYSAIAQAEVADRHLTIACANMLAMGSGCQVLIAGMDTLNAAYESAEQEVEIQKRWQEEGESSGMESSALVVYMKRGGYRWSHAADYVVERSTGTVTWRPEPETKRLDPLSDVGQGFITAFQRDSYLGSVPELRLACLSSIAQHMPISVAFHHDDNGLNSEYKSIARRIGLKTMDVDDDDDF